MTLTRQASLRATAAVAFHPALRRLLLFDASPQEIKDMATAFARLLEAAVGAPVSRVNLGSHFDDDTLWGVGEGLPIAWRLTGLLVTPESDPTWRLIVIPDLTTLALPSLRASVQLLEANVGLLERNGQSRKWPIRLAWLAACPSRAIGQVSRHLLDRFPLRLRATQQAQNSRANLRHSLENSASDERLDLDAHDHVHLIEAAKKAHPLLPPMTEQAFSTLEGLLARWDSQGVRRHLGLARLAQSLAALDCAHEVKRSHVDEAAGLIGVARYREPERRPSFEPLITPSDQISSAVDETHTEGAQLEVGPQIEVDPFIGTRVSGSAKHDHLKLLDAPGDVSTPDSSLAPYPEDSAPLERFQDTLRLPATGLARLRYRGGAAVGVFQTTDPGEVSVIPTLFAAAPFQAIRRKSKRSESIFLVSKADWRARLRTRRPDDLFMLLLDLTACEGCDWQTALTPHFRRAYQQRSEVCLILVGAQGAPHELRAEKIVGRSILAPVIGSALERMPGKATPLASGLHLAYESIREAQHRGQNSVLRTTLVVLTDGRGNVTLSASQVGNLSGPVFREGVDDALAVAARIKMLARVESTLLDPQPIHGRELVLRLADALGAQVELVQALVTAGQESA